MEQREFIAFLNKIEKLKCNTRHSWNSNGRRESVAEHCWRTAVMALLCADEYPSVDIDRVIKMCLVHDFGEAVTGDIPAFEKTAEHEQTERRAVKALLATLPPEIDAQFTALFDEMVALRTPEARLFKSLDNMEAVLSHNEADISTWLPNEYTDNLTYGGENVEWSEWMRGLKRELNEISKQKIRESDGAL